MQQSRDRLTLPLSLYSSPHLFYNITPPPLLFFFPSQTLFLPPSPVSHPPHPQLLFPPHTPIHPIRQFPRLSLISPPPYPSQSPSYPLSSQSLPFLYPPHIPSSYSLFTPTPSLHNYFLSYHFFYYSYPYPRLTPALLFPTKDGLRLPHAITDPESASSRSRRCSARVADRLPSERSAESGRLSTHSSSWASRSSRVRGEDGRIRSFHNACRHRAARGWTIQGTFGRRITCPIIVDRQNDGVS